MIVDFGNRRLLGIVVGTDSQSDVPGDKLKPVERVLDTEPVLAESTLLLLKRIASYYHHPLGEVIIAALPVHLREGNSLLPLKIEVFQALRHDAPDTVPELKKAAKQRALMDLLQRHPDGLSREAINEAFTAAAAPLKGLINKQLVRCENQSPSNAFSNTLSSSAPRLHQEQALAASAINKTFDEFQAHLLDGITGSGKTEVYLAVIAKALSQQRQTLVLVPEISLTPQLVTRFTGRFDTLVVNLHSGLNKTERQRAWQLAGSGEASIVLGTRSAVFTPLPQLGLIIVDEEHDASLKQQEGFRYHGRDVAIFRAQQASCPIVLGSATPSLETLRNALDGRYQHHRLRERAGEAQTPVINMIDLRLQKAPEGLSATLAKRIREHVKNGNQVLLFLNRRGYAPVMLCDDCGETIDCPRCDAHVTYHAARHELHCHHCGKQSRTPTLCPHCQGESLIPVGLGTQKIEAAINAAFPEASTIRIDRDSMTRKHSLSDALNEVRQGMHQIIIGTQLLAKGHDFHNITLVGMVDVDQGLFSTDFHAPERLVQQIFQVSGRAGRGALRGEVVIQTHQPDHPLLQAILHRDYFTIAKDLLEERRLAFWPPYSNAALFRAAAHHGRDAKQLLEDIAEILRSSASSDLQILGPVTAPMERKAGRYRYQLLLRSARRDLLHRMLRDQLAEIRKLNSARKARWSLDIDPMDLS